MFRSKPVIKSSMEPFGIPNLTFTSFKPFDARTAFMLVATLATLSFIFGRYSFNALPTLRRINGDTNSSYSSPMDFFDGM
ncbi:hypothetical protein D9M70_649770 [compost metagenome]